MKASKSLKVKAIVAVMVLAITPVIAQQQWGPGGQGGPGGPGGRGDMGQMRPGRAQGSLGMIIRMSSVQKELHLSPEQIKSINELRPMGQPGGQGGFGGPPPQGGQGQQGGFGGPPPQGGQGQQGGFGGPPPQGGQGQQGGFGGPPPQGGQGQQGGFGGPPQQGGQRQQGQGDFKNSPLGRILDESQGRRLLQLGLQFDAPMSFGRPEVGEKLNFTEEQRQAVREIIDSIVPRPQEDPQGRQGQQGQPPKIEWKTMQSKKAEGLAKVFQLLTAEQKSEWQNMTGKPFDQWEEPKQR